MKRYLFLLSALLIYSLISPFTVSASTYVYLPDDEGLELNWTITETPPKRPSPKILNPANYELKWKMDNSLMHNLVQDKQGLMYTSDSKDIIHAVYPNGKEKWQLHLDMGFEISVIYLTIGQDDTLYAYSSDILSEKGLTTIYAVTPEGNIKWKLQDNNIYSQFNSQFAGDAKGNFVYFTNEGLTSRNTKGEVTWVNKSITSSAPRIYSRSSHLVKVYLDSNGNVYLDSALGEVISLDSSGVERWRTKPLPYISFFTGFHPYLSAKGILYLLNEYGLHALSTHDGSDLDVSIHVDHTDMQSSGLPTDGNDGYYIEYRGRFLKINHNGDMLWEYSKRESEKNGLGSADQPLIDQEGNVYFTTASGNIIALNSQGEEIFVFLRNAFWSKSVSILLGLNGNIYATSNEIGLTAFGKKPIQVYLDNISMPLADVPLNKEGIVLVPFRSFFEQLGLKIEWEPSTRTITGSKEGLSIKLSIGEHTAFVNGQAQPLEEAPMIENNTTYVPLRFVGEALQKKVTWDGENSSINIDQ
ncbi:stalk domain-containing protein [Paenibacillus sp. LjRoot56]|uniref:stalk domain-containing protein n=1 Tax=Paenibacillus sp. LjRoot56 TaxID=3342333 RepID=UPI003ECEB103